MQTFNTFVSSKTCYTISFGGSGRQPLPQCGAMLFRMCFQRWKFGCDWSL